MKQINSFKYLLVISFISFLLEIQLSATIGQSYIQQADGVSYFGNEATLVDSDQDTKFEEIKVIITLDFAEKDQYQLIPVVFGATVKMADGSSLTQSYWSVTHYLDFTNTKLQQTFEINVVIPEFEYIVRDVGLQDASTIDFLITEMKISSSGNDIITNPISLTTTDYDNIDFQQRVELESVSYGFYDNDNDNDFDFVQVVSELAIFELIEMDVSVKLTIQSSTKWYQTIHTLSPSTTGTLLIYTDFLKEDIFSDGIPTEKIYWSVQTSVEINGRFVDLVKDWTDEMIIGNQVIIPISVDSTDQSTTSTSSQESDEIIEETNDSSISYPFYAFSLLLIPLFRKQFSSK